MSYRDIARKAVVNAKNEIDSGIDFRLRYAALELRMALEALIYEKAGLYKEELSNKKLSTWQPKKLLTLLLELDPNADKNSSLAFGIEEEYGKSVSKMTSLGQDRVLTLKEIKTYYDRLGSYLHTPTIEQSVNGKGSTPEKIKIRCLEIKEIIHEVLSSPVFNTDVKVTSSVDCGGCGTKIIRRIPHDSKPLIAKCINCSASYTLTTEEKNNEVNWQPNINNTKCANKNCLSPFNYWHSDVKLGTGWKCEKCKGENRIILSLQYKSPDELQNKV